MLCVGLSLDDFPLLSPLFFLCAVMATECTISSHQSFPKPFWVSSAESMRSEVSLLSLCFGDAKCGVQLLEGSFSLPPPPPFRRPKTLRPLLGGDLHRLVPP
eukprot:RCo000530